MDLVYSRSLTRSAFMLYFLISIRFMPHTSKGFLDVYEDITDLADTKGVSQPKSDTEYS